VDKPANRASSRQIDYAPPMNLKCSAADIGSDPNAPLSLCEYLNYFEWKRLMFEQGRLWFPGVDERTVAKWLKLTK